MRCLSVGLTLVGTTLFATSICSAQAVPVEVTGGTFEVGFSISAYNGYDGSVSRDSGGTFYQDPNFFMTLSDTVGGSVSDILTPGSATASASNNFTMTTTQDVANDNYLKIIGSGLGQVSAEFSNSATEFGFTSAGGQVRTISNVYFTTYEPVSFDIDATLSGSAPNGRAEIRFGNTISPPYTADTNAGQFVLNESGVLQPGDHALYYLVAANPNATLNGGPSTNNGGLNFEINLGPSADAYRWKNAAGGDFSTNIHWNPEAVPPSEKTVIFDLPNTYTINLNENRTVKWANVKAGDITFDVSSSTLTVDEKLFIGTDSSQSATVRISNPENFIVSEVVVGVADGANAKLILGPENAVIASAVTAQNDTPSPTIFPIAVKNKGQLEIKNQICTIPTLTVTPVPFPNIGQNQPDTIKFENSDITVEGTAKFSESSGDEAGSASKKGVISRSRLAANQFILYSFDVKVEKSNINTSLMKIGSTTDEPSGVPAAPFQPTVFIIGDASTIEATQQLTVGDDQQGKLEVTEGSSVETAVAILGNENGSFGEMTIGSNVEQNSIMMSNNLDIGRDGSARMHIMSGGQAIVSSLTRIVDLPEDNGEDEISLTIDLPATGELIVDDGGYFFAGQLDVGANGTVSGTGLIETTDGFNFEGTLKPGASPGQLNIIGPVNQGTQGVVEIDIAGTTPGDEYDVLSIVGDADFNGLFAFIFDGHSPRQGDIYEFLIVDGEINLDDAMFETRNLLPGFEFDITPTNNGFKLQALNDGTFVPEPTSFVILTIGSIALTRKRHRCVV